MSKCVAVLDSQKITEIRVRTKGQEGSGKAAGKPKQAPATAAQQSK